jgi:endonuclease YncB( thermonuclease family)
LRQPLAERPTILAGQASVIDGDTLEIHGTRIRLWGIDAPETTQLCRGDDSLPYRCGAKAPNDLDAFIARPPVNCIPISLDRYRRTVATYSVGDIDLGEWLVRNGLAIDWPKYSKGKFDAIRHEAEHAGRGIWTGSYIEPWLYRACIKAGGARPAAQTMRTRIPESNYQCKKWETVDVTFSSRYLHFAGVYGACSDQSNRVEARRSYGHRLGDYNQRSRGAAGQQD